MFEVTKSRQIVVETLNINILILFSFALDKTLTVSPSFEVLTGSNRGFHSLRM
jgi:hypothetical protein